MAFRLKSCPKHYTLDQDKTVAPLTTVRTALDRLGKRFDLSNLKLEQRHDEVPGAYSFSSLSDQLQASGKGLTREQSQASAIMEFLERYTWLHFDYAGYNGYTVGSFNEIKKGPTPTVDLPFFFHNFIGLRNRPELEAELVDVPLKWIKGVSLPDYKEYYYPINWYNYIFTSNGLATGNAIEEAILQATCEVIERENIYRLFGDKKVPNDIDPKSFESPLIRKVLRNAKKKGIALLFKDISFDLQVPTILVYGFCPEDKFTLTYKGCGYGTHPDPEKAAIRALSEYFESYSLLKSRQARAKIDWGWLTSRLPAKNYGFLAFYHPEMLRRRKKVVKIQDLKDFSRDDIKTEIEDIIKVLNKHKYRVIFIDKTHPELKTPVARIFIPMMRNLMVSECEDADYIMSEACYEGGLVEASKKHLRQSALKYAYNMPEVRQKIDPRLVFKEDYRRTLLAYRGYKKNAFQLMEQYEKAMKS